MKLVLGIVFFVSPGLVISAEPFQSSSSHPEAARLVADDMQIQALPNGELAAKLISREKKTINQYWRESGDIHIEVRHAPAKGGNPAIGQPN
jgi:hypothetical protein